MGGGGSKRNGDDDDDGDDDYYRGDVQEERMGCNRGRMHGEPMDGYYDDAKSYVTKKYRKYKEDQANKPTTANTVIVVEEYANWKVILSVKVGGNTSVKTFTVALDPTTDIASSMDDFVANFVSSTKKDKTVVIMEISIHADGVKSVGDNMVPPFDVDEIIGGKKGRFLLGGRAIFAGGRSTDDKLRIIISGNSPLEFLEARAKMIIQWIIQANSQSIARTDMSDYVVLSIKGKTKIIASEGGDIVFK